jgi:hypothetical protein
MTEITDEYRTDYALFVRKATDWTLKHATGDTFDASNISVVENTDLEKKKEMETQKGKKSPDRKSVASVVVDESVSCVEIRENIPVKRIKL